MIRVAPYLVLYEGTPDGDAVQIIRILHGSRKITPAMIATLIETLRDDDVGGLLAVPVADTI